MLSTPALFSDEARCFNHSERVLYGNFVITFVKAAEVIVTKLWLVFTSCVKKKINGLLRETETKRYSRGIHCLKSITLKSEKYRNDCHLPIVS